MPRTTINAQTQTRYADDGLILTMTAADVANLNQTQHTGAEVLIVRNTGASPYNFTITSVPDELGRTEDVVDSIAASEIRFYGPIPVEGFRQSDGMLYFQGANAALTIGIVRLDSFI